MIKYYLNQLNLRISFEVNKGKSAYSPYFFHILPTVTLMWVDENCDVLYIGWLVFQIRLTRVKK